MPRGRARFCGHSRAKSSFSVGIHNTIEEMTPYVVKMTCFTVKIVAPAAPPQKTATLSRIRAPGALGPAIWATWPPAARQNTVLSERPWLLSRARGGVRLRNAQHYRGIDATDGVRCGNLRHIRRCNLANSQHSRGFGVPTRGRAGDFRYIRRCRFRNWRHSRGFDAPVSQKADSIEESQSRVPILSCFIGPLGVRVVRFACGTPFLPGQTAKTQHIRGPGRPVRGRHTDSAPLGRRNVAPWRPGGAGGAAGNPPEQESQENTSEMYT